jgi:hypothetical protein
MARQATREAQPGIFGPARNPNPEQITSGLGKLWVGYFTLEGECPILLYFG